MKLILTFGQVSSLNISSWQHTQTTHICITSTNKIFAINVTIFVIRTRKFKIVNHLVFLKYFSWKSGICKIKDTSKLYKSKYISITIWVSFENYLNPQSRSKAKCYNQLCSEARMHYHKDWMSLPWPIRPKRIPSLTTQTKVHFGINV